MFFLEFLAALLQNIVHTIYAINLTFFIFFHNMVLILNLIKIH